MASSNLTGASVAPVTPTEMSPADRAAHVAASYVRRSSDNPSQEDEALRRARTPSRTISSVQRRDVRTAVSNIRGW